RKGKEALCATRRRATRAKAALPASAPAAQGAGPRQLEGHSPQCQFLAGGPRGEQAGQSHRAAAPSAGSQPVRDAEGDRLAGPFRPRGPVWDAQEEARPQHHFRTDRRGRAAVPDREVEAAMVRCDTGTPGSRRPDGHETTITTPIASESQLDAALAA